MEQITIPLLTIAGIIKVTTIIKDFILRAFKVTVSGYAAIALTVVISVVWKILELLLNSTTPVDWNTIWKAIPSAIALAIQSMIGFGVMANGMLGTKVKDLATKPLL